MKATRSIFVLVLTVSLFVSGLVDAQRLVRHRPYYAPRSRVVYVAPRPVYVAPQRVYVAPRRVYVAPRRVYVAPRPLIVRRPFRRRY